MRCVILKYIIIYIYIYKVRNMRYVILPILVTRQGDKTIVCQIFHLVLILRCCKKLVFEGIENVVDNSCIL